MLFGLTSAIFTRHRGLVSKMMNLDRALFEDCLILAAGTEEWSVGLNLIGGQNLLVITCPNRTQHGLILHLRLKLFTFEIGPIPEAASFLAYNVERDWEPRQFY